MTIYRVYRDFDCCNSIVEHLLFESVIKSECEDFVQAVLKSDVSKDINRYRIVECEWYQNDRYGGYFNDQGYFDVVVEFGTDADFDTHSVAVQNGYGYYDENGKYRSFGKDID